MLFGSTAAPLPLCEEGDDRFKENIEHWKQRARALVREFAAPVGLLDPSGSPTEDEGDDRGSWLVQTGGPDVEWPSPDRAARIARDARGGDVTLWSPGPDADHLWLILPLPEKFGLLPTFDDSEPLPTEAQVSRPRSDSTLPRSSAHILGLTAWIGFATITNQGGQLRGEEGRSISSGPWGPSCPPQALRAWGREMAARLGYRRSLGSASSSSSMPLPPRREDRQESRRRRLPDRLLKKLRVSDPPELFQRLAVAALRTALEVEAVVWVPQSLREPVIRSGTLDGLSDEAIRLLVPETPNAAGCLYHGLDEDSAVVGVREALAVAADAETSAGWLVAVNPTDDRAFGTDDADLLRPVASLIGTQRINARHYAELKDLLVGVIRSLTSAVDAKDSYTLGHSERVGRIAIQLGEVLGLSANERGDLYLMGLLHDVGKIGIEDSILKKTGPLTSEEFRQIQSHVRIGIQILSDLKKLHHLLPGVAHHHENYDGTGYPDGLAGEAIPLAARIMAVADAFDAMSSSRPYRKRLAPSQIDAIFQKGAGTQWDPRVVDALFSCRSQLERIRQKGLGDSVMQVVDHTVGRS